MLELKNVWIYYGKHIAGRNMSLSVNKHDFIAILGANGAGKTSTLNAISGIVQVKKGEIHFKGKKINGLEATKIASMGIIQVPEGRRIFPLLTVRENLQVGAYLQKDSKLVRRSLEKALDIFPDLKDKLNAKGRELSGGQQQMLAIARGLMAQPEVLLLDEPSLGLAPILRQQLAKRLKEIALDEMTIVLVEQNARLGLMLASYGYVMDNGEIALQGKASDLLNSEDVKKAYLGV